MDAVSKALAGKRIVVTRSPDDAGVLLHKFKGAGARVILLPCIEFQPAEDLKPLDAALSHLREFDWIVLTSQHAAKFLCGRMRELGQAPVDKPTPPQVAAIGAATFAAAGMERLHVDLVTSSARSSREFVAEFAPHIRGKKVLLPQSDLAGERVAEGLRESGAQVTSVVAYRTCMPKSLNDESLAEIRREGADVFVFASPSAFRNFAKAVGAADLKHFGSQSALAAIGPTTARAIREAGVPVAIESAKPSTDEIIKAMSDYFSKQRSAKARR